MASLTPRVDSLEGARNVLINGNMDLWQRSTSIATITSNTFVADRWRYLKSGTMVHTYSRQTDVPTQAQSGFQSSFSLHLNTTTAQASLSDGHNMRITYSVEGHDYAILHGRACRLQFWIKSNKVGTYGIYFRNSASNRSYVTTYTINSASTWEKKTIDFTADTAGTWLFDNGTGLDIGWVFAGTSTTNTAGSLNTWLAGNFTYASTQTNGVDTVSNTFQLAQVSLMPMTGDSTAADIPFRRAGKNIAEELIMCQRYYEKTHTQAVTPADNADSGGSVNTYSLGTGPQNFADQRFVVTKRVSPTITFYNPLAVAAGTWRDVNNNANLTMVSALTGETSFIPRSSTSVATTGTLIRGYWTADAEL